MSDLFMKNIFLDFYANGNLGDDLFVSVLLNRYPNTMFYVSSRFDSVYEITSRYNNLKNIPFRDISIVRKLFVCMFYNIKMYFLADLLMKKWYSYWSDKYNLCDIYVGIGGSVFMQKQSYISFGDYKRLCITNAFLEKKKVIIGANWGPCKTRAFYSFYKKLLVQYNDVCFRDCISYFAFKDLPNVRFCADVVFQIPLKIIDKIPESVGVSVINLSGRKELLKKEAVYIRFMSDLARKCIENNRNITFFSFCKNEGDEDCVDLIKLELGNIQYSSLFSVVNYRGDVDSFMNEYAKCESVLASRFHAMILSFGLKQNVVPLVYSNKMLNVLEDLNFKELFIPISEMEKYSVISVLDAFEKYSFSLDKSVIDSSEGQFNYLDSFCF